MVVCVGVCERERVGVSDGLLVCKRDGVCKCTCVCTRDSEEMCKREK